MADWIAVDWGSSHLRAWAMDAAGAVLDEASSDAGAGRLAPPDFEPALLALISPWLGERRLQIVVCGMGRRPAGLGGGALRPRPLRPRRRLRPRARAGCAARRAAAVRHLPDQPPDVMRGEETQIAGLLAADPGFDGVVCLPGTFEMGARRRRPRGGEVFHFASFMTGELFDLLSRRSVLRHTVAEEGHDAPAFAEALDEALSRPERAFARLFSLRAEALVGEADPAAVRAAARARLSGLLIGAELAAAKPYWLGRRVALIGAEGLSDLYAAALAQTGLTAERRDAARCTLDGLRAARLALMEGSPCRAN